MKSASGAERYFYCQDANWNVIALREGSNIVERYEYDPYGNVRIFVGYDSSEGHEELTVVSRSVAENPILFAGYYFDNETGLYHVRHRIYSPTLQRWLQRDPAGYADGMNLYEYAKSTPFALSDPRGLYGAEVHKDLTSTIAANAGFRDKPAQDNPADQLGEADNGVDGPIGPTGWVAWGLDWHFDIDTPGGKIPAVWDATDSRYVRSQEQMSKAVRLCTEEGRGKDAVRELGRGLHPIQDWYAHGNWRVWFGPIFLLHPDWYDDTGKDGSGPGGVPVQDPDDVWSKGHKGTTRYNSMKSHTERYIKKFITRIRAVNTPSARKCRCYILKNP